MNVYASNYLRSLKKVERRALAEHCGLALGSLQNIIYGKPPSVMVACRIEEATCGAVRREDLRPDVNWALISGTSLEGRMSAARKTGE